jgi:hypothetical protein
LSSDRFKSLSIQAPIFNPLFLNDYCVAQFFSEVSKGLSRQRFPVLCDKNPHSYPQVLWIHALRRTQLEHELALRPAGR